MIERGRGVTGPDTTWPKKTRECVDALMDSTVWNDFGYREGDIVIATYPKAGTTWLQQIVAQLIFDGEDVPVGDLSPWVEFSPHPRGPLLEALEQQRHRRFVKTHLPIDALVFSPAARYIYSVRDGRDVAFSFHHFHSSLPPRPGLDRPDPDRRQYFNHWLDRDGYPYQSFFTHIQGWWNVRDLPNVLLVHYDRLKADLPGQIRRIARFLSIEINEGRWPRVVEHCSFDYMKRNAEVVAPARAAAMTGGKASFFRSGTSGGWRDVLTDAESAKYEASVAQRLTPECARWLNTGEAIG